uniref:Uncharacterized protein n=1 Tax=Oryza punctata TaxID=4537 RepID=A0A0E0LHV6_ORYPU
MAIEEVMAEDMHSMNATVIEQAVAKAGAEVEANTELGLAAEVLETVAEAEALEAESDVVTAVSRQSGDLEAMTLEEASPEKHGM